MKILSIKLILLIFFMTGCRNTDIPAIDEYTWEMSSIQSIEANGQAIAYGEQGSSTIETAKKVKLICFAENGTLTLSDQTNHKRYTGEYDLIEVGQKSTNYNISIDGKEGIGVVSMTTYHDNSQSATFILTFEDYTLNFFGKQENAE